jgi:sarcosine oxidase subunit gamma
VRGVTADALARSPLAGREDDLAVVGAAEVPFLAQVAVRIDVRGALGPHPLAGEPGGPPTAPNTWSAVGDREWLWLGPDEWLVLGPAGSAAGIVDELEERLAGRHHSVVDVSANRAALELSEADRLELLAQGCGLDLHPRSWTPGRCAQTLLAGVPVLLQERDRATRIFVRPSFAGWLVDWLLAVGSA